MIEEGSRYTFSRDRNLRRQFLVGIWDRWAGNDDGEDTVLHIRDNLLDLFSSSETTEGAEEREDELWYRSERP